MLDFVIFAVVFIIFLLGLLFLLYPGKPKKSCAVPGPDPADEKNGNFADIRDAGSLHSFLAQLHEEYGPIAGFWWGQKFVVSTAGPDAFRSQINLFNKPKELYDELLMPFLGETSLLFLNDNEGRYLRLNLERPFHNESCGNYLHIITEISERVASKWKTFDSEKHIPVRQYMLALTLQITMRCLFGEYFANDEVLFQFAKNFDICWSELEARFNEPDSPLDDVRMKNFERAKKELHQQIIELVKRRKSSESETELFIDDLKNTVTSEDQIVSLVLTYVFCGFHTTANLLTWLIYYLSKHPKCEERVYKEIVKVVGEDKLMTSTINDLLYVRQVVEETMRLSSIVPWTARIAPVDLKIGSYVIPKETPIIQALGVVCQSADFWDDPLKFDPERFQADKVKHIDSLLYPYFGFAGKRKCPGSRLAYFEAVAVLSVLIKNFKISLADPKQIAVPVYGLTTRPEDEIYITLELR